MELCRVITGLTLGPRIFTNQYVGTLVFLPVGWDVYMVRIGGLDQLEIHLLL